MRKKVIAKNDELIKLTIPATFAEMLDYVRLSAYASKIVEILQWATKHKTDAKKIAKEFQNMTKREQELFIKKLQYYSETINDVRWSFDNAIKDAAQEQRHRSLLGKMVYAARHNGYKFKFGDKRVGTITVNAPGEYVVLLQTANSQVRIIYRPSALTSDIEYFLKTASSERVCTYGIKRIEYLNATYDASKDAGQKILAAVANNLQPEIAAIVLDDKNTELGAK